MRRLIASIAALVALTVLGGSLQAQCPGGGGFLEGGGGGGESPNVLALVSITIVDSEESEESAMVVVVPISFVEFGSVSYTQLMDWIGWTEPPGYTLDIGFPELMTADDFAAWADENGWDSWAVTTVLNYVESVPAVPTIMAPPQPACPSGGLYVPIPPEYLPGGTLASPPGLPPFDLPPIPGGPGGPA